MRQTDHLTCLETPNLSVDEGAQTAPILTLLLQKLSLESSSPVESSLYKFQHIPSPPATDFVRLSPAPPNIFTSFSDIETSYSTWLTLPVPSPRQHSTLCHALVHSSNSSALPALSLEVSHLSQSFNLPTWIISAWPHLRRLISCCQLWTDVLPWALDLSEGSGAQKALGACFVNQLTEIPLDSPIPSLNFFRSSDLTGLLGTTWLSDEHINAAGDYINLHPNRLSTVYVLSSFFLPTLRLNLARFSTWAPRRPIPLDTMILDGSVTELLIPVNRPSHWALTYINISTRQYSYIDTLDLNFNKLPWSCLDSLDRWLSCVLGINIALLPMECPFMVGPQTDSHSCGVAVLSSMAHFALGGDFPYWTQSSARDHRIRWAMYLSDLVVLNVSTTSKQINSNCDSNLDYT